jgi:hypothetical protein
MKQIINAAQDCVREGWQVSSVWIVPPTSHVSKSGDHWEAHLMRPDFVALGEDCNEDIDIDINTDQIPLDVRVRATAKVHDVVVELPPMSEEQAEAVARGLLAIADAIAVHKTASGCWSVGPCAAWTRPPLQTAILNSRKK